MVRKHLAIIGRDAAPSVSDILRRDSAASGMQALGRFPREWCESTS
jgi:hypothetical protein